MNGVSTHMIDLGSTQICLKLCILEIFLKKEKRKKKPHTIQGTTLTIILHFQRFFRKVNLSKVETTARFSTVPD